MGARAALTIGILALAAAAGVEAVSTPGEELAEVKRSAQHVRLLAHLEHDDIEAVAGLNPPRGAA